MIDLMPLDHKTNVWVSVSGGADSALLLYLIVKYLYDTNSRTKVTPWCYVDTSRPGNDTACRQIIECITNLVPYTVEPLLVDYLYKSPGGNKVELTEPLWNNHAKSGLYDMYATAISAAPPEQEMKSIPGFYQSFQKITTEDRTLAGKELSYSGQHAMHIWRPFINLNKKHLAALYDEHDLLDNIFPLTKSCISRNKTPCFECFWCYEKVWAFGMYDYP